METHIITVCLLIIAVEPSKKLFRGVDNWIHRMLAHRAHMEKMKNGDAQ